MTLRTNNNHKAQNYLTKSERNKKILFMYALYIPVWLVLRQFFGYSLPVFALAPHVLHVLPPKGEDMLRC